MHILLTGSTGFLGNIFLQQWKGKHDVTTIGRSGDCDIKFDFTNDGITLPQFDMVVHAAGKAHVIPVDAETG